MKAFIYLTALLICLTCENSIAQLPEIPNGNFENWQNVGQSTEEPTNWNSNKTGGGYATLGPQTCYRESSNPYNGTYCVRIESKTYLTTVVNGSCTTGKVEAPSMNKAEGYVQTIKNDPLYSSPFTGRPDSLIGYYRYTSVSSDYGKIAAKLHVGNCYDPETPVNGNHPDSTVNVIARATFLTPSSTVSSWTRFAVPFIYVDGRTPQYILIAMTSSGNQTGGSNGSKLWVDGLTAFYNPVLLTGGIGPTTYYVTTTQGASVTIPFTLTGTMNPGNIVTAQLSDASGSFANPVILGTLATTTSGTINGIIPAGTPTGSGYRIRVVSSNYALTAPDNGTDIQIYLVNNSVAPSAPQNIEEMVAGTPITVTENPAGTSREWKYSTLSGGPYASFSPAETGITYTPLFSSQGTYYVVCESQIGGLTVTSQEVTINVSPATGINEAADNINLKVFVAENRLKIYTNEHYSGSRFIICDISGRKISEQSLQGPLTEISLRLSPGIYLYSLTSTTAHLTGKFIIR